MPRFHATSSGNVPFTPEEEIARDAEEAAAILTTAAEQQSRRNTESAKAVSQINTALFERKLSRLL